MASILDMNSPANFYRTMLLANAIRLQEGVKQRWYLYVSQKNLRNSSGIFRKAHAKVDLTNETENKWV